MKFEAGKFYRTETGSKAQIFIMNSGNKKMIGAIKCADGWLEMKWNEDGSYQFGTQFDLVGEWEEPKPPKLLAPAIRKTGTGEGYVLSTSLYDSEESARKTLQGMFISWPAIPKDGFYEVPQ